MLTTATLILATTLTWLPSEVRRSGSSPMGVTPYVFVADVPAATDWPPMPRVHLAGVTEGEPSLERLPTLDPDLQSSSNGLTPAYSPNQFEPLLDSEPGRRSPNLWSALWQDQFNYYSWETLRPSLMMFGVGAILANTQIDQQLRNDWQEDVHSERLRSVAVQVRNFGDGSYVIPTFVGLWMGGSILGDLPGANGAATWGSHTTRSILVGFPAMLVMQQVTGGSRPLESSEVAHPSHWKFWQDNNGVSGHTFIGAIPFLTAAGLVDDPTAKGVLLLGSTLVGISRIETDSHYLSQVVLGWWMAFIATNAVQQTAYANSPYSVSPLMMNDGMGLAFNFRR